MPISERELEGVEARYKHWEEIPKGQFPCSWATLGRLLETIRELQSQLNSKSKRRSKKEQIAEELRDSDLMAKLTGRTDIEHGHHDTLPQGQHVARMQAKGEQNAE